MNIMSERERKYDMVHRNLKYMWRHMMSSDVEENRKDEKNRTRRHTTTTTTTTVDR